MFDVFPAHFLPRSRSLSLQLRWRYVSLGMNVPWNKFPRVSAHTHLCLRHRCPSVRYSCRVYTWRWIRSWEGLGGIPVHSSHRTVRHTRPDTHTALRGSLLQIHDSPVEPYPTQRCPKIHILKKNPIKFSSVLLWCSNFISRFFCLNFESRDFFLEIKNCLIGYKFCFQPEYYCCNFVPAHNFLWG